MEDRNILKKNIWIQVFLNLVLAAAAGLLIENSFVPRKIFFLIFFAFVPFFIAIENAKPIPAFLYGLITGFVLYSLHFHWLTIIWGFKFVIILILYISLYYGVFGYLISVLKLNENLNIKKIFIISTVWIIGEFIRARFLGGYPTASIAHALFEKPLLIQIADLGGFYLISFFIVWINLFIYSVISKKVEISNKKLIAIHTLIILLIILSYSTIKYFKWKNYRKGRAHSILLIQPAIDQHKKWDPVYRAEVFKLIESTFPIIKSGYDLVIFPETVCPTEFRYEKKSNFKMKEYSKLFKDSFMLFGSVDYSPDPFILKEYRLKFNSAFLMKGGELLDKYDKVLPVVFAEHNPFKERLPYFNKFVLGESIEPGFETNVLEADDLKIGTLICYESIFPRLSRGFIRNGANILINISNEAWFNYLPTSQELLAASVFRSVEFRRYFVKVSNTGISAVVTPSGKIFFKIPLFVRANQEIEVRAVNVRTPYSVYGDWYILVFLIITIFVIARKERSV